MSILRPLFFPQLLPAEDLAPFRAAIVATADQHRTESRPLRERDTYGKAFLQIFNLWTRNETVRRFVLAPRFAEVAARLMGVEAVRIYHDQALFKESGGSQTPRGNFLSSPTRSKRTKAASAALLRQAVALGAARNSGCSRPAHRCPRQVNGEPIPHLRIRLVADMAWEVGVENFPFALDGQVQHHRLARFLPDVGA